MLITANQPFGEWGRIFLDQASLSKRISKFIPANEVQSVAICLTQTRTALSADTHRARGAIVIV